MARISVTVLIFLLGGCASYDPESGRYIRTQTGAASLAAYRCQIDPLIPNCAYLIESPAE